ncbi:MAG TPA: DUF4435 domain-containing protein [Chthoniobacterales bacterium]|nr:DUF4435 domain-containing protein [Chthoniobacterales bacterium]
MTEDKRPLDEIIARYELNPSLCDVYVEGGTDRGILEAFLEDCGAVDVIVYDIETINIPASTVRGLGLENNNRGRVIALSRILYEKFGAKLPVSGIVDADFDIILGIKENCPLVLMTDYTSMEMYFFNSKALKKFIRSVCPSLGMTADALLQAITLPLKQLFLARLANRVLQWRMKSVPAERSCKVKPGKEISFDFNGYLKKYLSKNSRICDQTEFLKVIARWEKKCAGLDPRCCIHGHDFVEMVALFCSKLKAASEVKSGDLVSGMLRCGAVPSDLRAEPMFQLLLNQCAAV